MSPTPPKTTIKSIFVNAFILFKIFLIQQFLDDIADSENVIFQTKWSSFATEINTDEDDLN